MPRFFFEMHVGIGVGVIASDGQGQECADVHAARRIATRYASDLLRDTPDRLWRKGDCAVRVRDERGFELFSVEIIGKLTPAGREMIWRAANPRLAGELAAE